jgi:hypothetical protein
VPSRESRIRNGASGTVTVLTDSAGAVEAPDAVNASEAQHSAKHTATRRAVR